MHAPLRRSLLVVAPRLVAGALLVGVLALATSPSAAAQEAQPPVEGEVGHSTGSGIDDSIVRLYLAFFERVPDPDGLAHWGARHRRGERVASIANAFARSAEFQARYGTLSDPEFVGLVYANVLGREPDSAGFDHWIAQLGGGTLTRGSLMSQFSQSAEYVGLTGTLPPEAPPAVVPADSGHGRRIIYCVSCQHVWLVEESGLLVRHYAVSGRVNTPRAGTYQVFSKSPLAWAGHHGITMEYMVRYTWGNTLALGFHSIPKRPNGTFLQTEDELGQYRSAGCTRQRLDDARFLYEWAPVGTTVVVLP